MTLRVKLEIVPFGDEDKAYEIGRLDIFNKGPFVNGFYNYGVLDLTPGQEGMSIADIHHRRQNGAWILVKKAIDELDITGPNSPSPTKKGS